MRLVFRLMGLAGVLLAASGCGAQVQGKATEPGEVPSKSQSAAEQLLVPIEASLPQRSDMASYFETTSRIMAESRVEVVAKAVGQCKEVRVQEGDYVKAGDVLAVLDGKELEAQIRQTRANLEQVRYQMETAQEQFKRGVLSEFEARMPKYSFEQASAMLELQQIQLDNLTIRAPISGVVTQKILQPGMQVAAGIPVFSITDPASFILPVSVPEKELSRLKEAQRARVTIDAHPDQELIASVKRINPSVDPLSGTVKVTLAFDESARPFLREAAFARVRLIMETHENALVIPKDTMIEENGRHYVMVVRQDPAVSENAETNPRLVAERIEIQTGLEDSNFVEVVSGIDENTLIVTLGQHTLKPGTAVKITNAADEVMSKVNLSAEEALARARNKEVDLDGGRGDRREKLIR